MPNWFEKILKGVMTDNRYHLLDASQVSAYMDAITLTMAVDRHIASEERDQIEHLLAHFEWPTDRPSEHMINISLHRAWDVLGGDESMLWSYCREIAKRLGDGWLLENTYEACLRIMHSDGVLHASEQDLSAKFAECFGLADDRMDHIQSMVKKSFASKVDEADSGDIE